MLTFFPILYEDELLYSWFARYHICSCNISPKLTMEDLFDSKKALAVHDLPTHLQKLHKQLELFNIPKVEYWIFNHTFYRYYTTFAKSEIKKQVCEAMKNGTHPGAIHLMTGIMASSIKEPPNFRYCPECLEDDFNNYGETYWRLTHQLPGVLVCPKHSIF